MTGVALPRPVRVAIYTRKSVVDGLEQSFNSLDAQRQAIEAYVASQAGLGWTAIPKRFDDGGFSGSTTERPAFKSLLRDIEDGRVDVVAVYKIDRLSRSLRDFAKLIDLFERRSVTFVSVTQQFSTANSMGRLTLNILMSFAEFEREVIGERIRDKVRATRRRGAWTGGRPVLGYDVVDRKLVVNQDEALQVRATFQLYLERGSLRETAAELRRRGWRNKSFTSCGGRDNVGRPFSNATLHALLTNPLYRGLMRCSSDLVQGEHEAIVDGELWDAVQDRLKGNGRNGGAGARNKTGATLRGLVRCGRCGSPFVHAFTTKGSRRNRYYVCRKLHEEGAAACPGARVPAGKFESFVASQIRAMGRDEDLLAKTAESVVSTAAARRQDLQAERRRAQQELGRPAASDEHHEATRRRLAEVDAELQALDGAVDEDDLRSALAGFAPVWDQLFPREQERILRLLIDQITYDPDSGDVELDLRPCGIATLAKEARETP